MAFRHIVDELSKTGGIAFRRDGQTFEGCTKGESKEEFSKRVIEGNNALMAIAAEGNSEYDRWNVVTTSGIVCIYISHDGIVRITPEDA